MADRSAEIKRFTSETEIKLSFCIDGQGDFHLDSGIPFFDHMLNGFTRHGLFDLSGTIRGDIEVDSHHTIEDTGIVLGKAFQEALQDKGGIARFGSFYVPMDEALAFCSLDISGRPFLVFQAEFVQEQVGSYDSCMTEEFFRALATNAGITMHVKLEYGKNTHHCVEAIYKAVAHAMRLACKQTGGEILSTKGVL